MQKAHVMVYNDSKYELLVIHDTLTYCYGMYTTIRSRIQYTHREHSPLSHLRPTKGKVAKFTSSRRRTLVNALFHKSHTLPLSPMGFLQENATANIVIIIEEYNINNVFSPLSAFLFSKTQRECRFFTNFGTSKEHRMEGEA